MKNNRYKPLIERALELGCNIEYGSKHAKVYHPTGRLITVWAVNGSKDLQGSPSYELRTFEKQFNKA
jgi:hypothetical protein